MEETERPVYMQVSGTATFPACSQNDHSDKAVHACDCQPTYTYEVDIKCGALQLILPFNSPYAMCEHHLGLMCRCELQKAGDIHSARLMGHQIGNPQRLQLKRVRDAQLAFPAR